MTMADLLHWASGLDWQEDYEYAPAEILGGGDALHPWHRDMAAFTADHDAYAGTGSGVSLLQR